MAFYNFTLKFSGITHQVEGLEDVLYESSCDDALIYTYGNSIYVEFDREADSLDDAITSAIENIESAILGVILEFK
jgi:hypothetical protein